jgi:hypothetical protein
MSNPARIISLILASMVDLRSEIANESYRKNAFARASRNAVRRTPEDDCYILWRRPSGVPDARRLRRRFGGRPLLSREVAQALSTMLHQNISSAEIGCQERKSLTVQRDGRSLRAGARDRWCTMRDEFASIGFLAVTVAGLVLLCSGLVAFAFT